MDAQHAAGSDKTKPVASESKRLANEPDESNTTASTLTKPSLASGSSVLALEPRTNVADDDRTVTVAAGDANSDTETIILPGKDGHSPSKVRKVKHEQKSDEEGTAGTASGRKQKDAGLGGHREKDGKDGKDGDRQSGAGAGAGAGATGSADGASSNAPPKKKKLHDRMSDKHPHPHSALVNTSRSKDGTSSSISSAPTSPRPKHRRPAAGDHSDSESDAPRYKSKSPKFAKDRIRNAADKTAVGHKRKAPRTESEDEAESKRARRQRTSISRADSHPAKAATSRDQKATKSQDPTDRHRSTSPHPQRHRRSLSTQLSLSNGLSQKKKRIPAPLQSTDYHSDESSASGSPHPRSSRLHGLTTPATADSTASPAKMAPHKKHLDAHGQTLLARACARGEYDIARQRLQERPEDLNVADYAGNTPLQIAAINGCEDIVQLLIEAGCNLECVNYDKDTPLLDAVDNGHLGVIKLLLNAGVNPRKANVNGEEPIDRIRDDLDNSDEIRAALQEARQRMGERRRTSEEHHPYERPETRDSHGPDSPRRSPQSSSHAASTGRHARTVRATKTSNHLLYMPMDDKTLRQAAGKGDQETVMRILQVRDGCDDAESMVNAARGGHEVVLQLLLALGSANPDPPPLAGMAPEVSTPMLAAIGQENIKVIELLLEQGDFDPTRRFKGETYHEIARRRQGTHWKEEETILKNAYDSYRKKNQKDGTKTKSPSRRERDREQEREAKRLIRNQANEELSRAHKRNLSSPSRESETKKKSSKAASPKEKRRSNSFNNQDERTSPKRGPGRPKKEVPTINVSERESSPALHRTAKVKRAESDVAGASSEGENLKPRRKLVSKGELNKGEREKQRRASQAPSAMKDSPSPRPDDSGEKPKADKHLDRKKALKRDESRDRLSVSGESTSKHHHSSSTPPPSSTGEKDDSEVPLKRRRLDVEGKERRQKLSSSTEDRPANKSGLSRETSVKSVKSNKSSKNRGDDDDRREGRVKKSDPQRRESAKSSSSEKSIHVKYEDVEMEDAPYTSPAEDATLKAKREAEEAAAREKEEQKRREAEEKERERKKQEEAEAKRKEEERKRKAEEEKKRKAEEEKKLKAEEEQKRKAEEEKKRKAEEEQKRKAEEERKRKAEEEERKRKEEEERRRKEEEERKRREIEEEKRRKEEEERKRREEEERKRKEEEERKRKEEERKRQEEEERKRREEERLRREQLEREAAEAARRKREEEERKERELRERQRAAREAELRRIREEQERIRLDKLPGLFRWLDQCPNPKTPELAQKFSRLLGFRYETLRPEASGKPEGRELWTLNLGVALLLGTQDLSLSAYTAWERTPASPLAKKVIWALVGSHYSMQDLPELAQQLPDYYGPGATKLNWEDSNRIRSESRERFMKMDLFFVKVSDLMYIVPNISHLRGLKITVTYKELPESESDWLKFKPTSKWKQDGEYERFLGTGFGPREKYYVNGVHIGDEEVEFTPVSNTPFPEPRYPRRHGIYRVYPGEPDYEKLCRAQGLEHLLQTPSQSPSLPNGFHPPLMGNSHTPLHSAHAPAVAQKVNGTGHSGPNGPNDSNGSEDARPMPPTPPPNGINGIIPSEENGR